MKTLRILLTVIIAFCFLSVNAGDIKPVKDVQTESFGFFCMCAGEWLDVEAEVTTIYKLHGMQLRIKGIATGADSGMEYNLSSVENLSEILTKGFNQNYTWTMSITLDGEEISTIHQNVHVTINATGEVVVDFGRFFIDCH